MAPKNVAAKVAVVATVAAVTAPVAATVAKKPAAAASVAAASPAAAEVASKPAKVAPTKKAVAFAVESVAPVVVATPVAGGGAKKAPNAYQVFVNTKVAELKVVAAHAGKKYMELRALANVEWRILHPVDESKPRPVRKPRTKKAKSDAVAIPKKDKVKRAPSAYNKFISGALAELKAELAAKPTATKPDQKDMMKLAAGKWQAHKASIAK